jgi:hypothetical protein
LISQNLPEAYNMTLLADLVCKDPKKVWFSSCEVRRLRDIKQLLQLADHLEEIKDNFKDASLRAALAQGSAEMEFALRKLEHMKKSTECMCSLYLVDDLFNPVEEARLGNIRMNSTVQGSSKGIEHYECECALCGTKYLVEENEFGHTWWAWRLVRNGVADRARAPYVLHAPIQQIGLHQI